MAEPIEANVRGIIEHFADLPDPRSSVNQRHLLVDVIVIAVCAVLSRSDGPTEIEEWALCREDWLLKHLSLPNGIPSHDTFRRVLQRLPPAAFQRCFAAWLQSLVGPEGATHLVQEIVPGSATALWAGPVCAGGSALDFIRIYRSAIEHAC